MHCFLFSPCFLMSFFGLKQDYVFYLHFYPLDDIQPVLSTTASHCIALYSCAVFKILLCRACFSTLNVFACLKFGSSFAVSSFYPQDNIQPVSSQCTCWTLHWFVFLHCLWNCSARSLLRNRSTTFCCNIPQWNAFSLRRRIWGPLEWKPSDMLHPCSLNSVQLKLELELQLKMQG